MKNADDLRAAVVQIREQAGLSVRSMADLLGMSASGYRHYETRIKDSFLPQKVALAMADVLEPRGVDREVVLALSDPSARPVRVELGDQDEGERPLIPVYDVAASAGFGALVDYEAQTHSLAFPPDYLRTLTSSAPTNLAIIAVKGDSMEPTLLDNDIVLVDMSKQHMGFEGMFVLRQNDTLLVKRASMAGKKGHVMLISDNALYPPIEAVLSEIEVIGKVLWYGRKV